LARKINFKEIRNLPAGKMVKKSKLLLALDAHKGRDYKREYQKKLTKAADKKKKAKSGQNSGVQLGQKKVWILELD
jgi:hypothetical protein